tara:strand:+ start:50 stop:1378 length:1329 start_codon:yes stop_codon:yes gene_type:complete
MQVFKRKDGNKTLCMAPWTHTYLSPQTERRMCCASTEKATSFKQYIDTGSDAKEYNPKTLDEHWNSEHMKSVRRRMMAGEELPECQVCNNKLLNTDVYRTYFNSLFGHKEEDLWRLTNADGSTEMPVVSFDYRFSNLCNFKCRMCGDMLSSSWEAEQRKNDMWSPWAKPWMAEPVRSKIKQFQEDEVEKEFARAVDNHLIEEIYWVGGEPLMYEQHWKYMKQIVDQGDADKVYVRYNTNLSRTKYKGIDLYNDLLVHFKDWQICASIDGTGQIGEWIRDGLDYEKWLQNFKDGVAIKRNSRQMRLDVTLTLPGLLEVKNLFRLSKRFNVEMLTKVVFTFTPDIVLSPLALPRKLLDEIVDELLDFIEPRADRNQQSLIDVLKNLKTRPNIEETWPDTFKRQLQEGKIYQEDIGRLRKDYKKITLPQILSQDDRLINWWEAVG